MINLKNKDSVAAKIEEILQQEALKGQQHQIDKNKNKKIDAQDFAILRGEKKEVKEELKGQQHQIDKNKNNKIDSQDFAILRGEKKSVKKEEVEQIDELSKSTLGSYVKGAARDASAARKLSADFKNQADKSRKPSSKAAATRLSNRFYDASVKRHTGIGKAVERLTKEDVEQVIEREMTKSETAEKERIVKGMKKSLSGFKARYGDRAKNVMYATATKQAMKEEEQVDENAFDWKKPRPPESKGGAGVKQGRAYGGAAQKSKPEQEDNEKKK